MREKLIQASGATEFYNFQDLIGDSPEFKKAIELGLRFAKLPENILLIGESGTGKELFAQSIHNEYCPAGPFIAINCAAMPKGLIETELFGYEGGSFTGAERGGRLGKIELANGGTLFLDEIGDMPLEIQAVLLRVLEDKRVMRVGGRCYKKVNFRVIAATNKDLYEMVKKNLFREDLFFRLKVLSINLPPLRQRGNDVEILSQYFIRKYCHKLGWKVPKISPPAQKKILEYQWPGNVRQLENAIIYAINVAHGGVIEPKNLPDYILLDNDTEIDDKGASTERKSREIYAIKDAEKILVEKVLTKAKYDLNRTSNLLGISKSTLYRKIKEYNIEI